MKYQIKIADWLTKDKKLPKEIICQVTSETEKAVRIQYNDLFYWLPKSQVSMTEIKDPPETFGEALLVQKKLFPFQEQGVKELLRMKSALLADEMGLGKTLQAIAYACRSCRIPVLVVCPASLSINWEREINGAVIGARVQRITSGKQDLEPDMHFYIIPYSLINKFEEVGLFGIRLLVLDEAHYVKNYKAKRTISIIKLADSIRNRLGLTGTPIVNHQTEIFNIMRCIKPELLGRNYYDFLKSYCIERGYKNYIIPEWKQKPLNDLISTHMVRRTKNEVLKDLPEKLTSIIPIEIDLKQYHETVREVQKEYFKEKHFSMSELVQLEKERQLTGKLKIESGLEVIEDILDQGESVVVFGIHKEILHYANSALKKYNPRIIIGEQSLEDRQKAVDDFQNGVSKVIVVSIQAGGVGITLTRASKCVFLEFDWSAANMRQAEDRLHRIGQHSNVNVYYIVARNTLDEYIMQVIQGKAKSFHDMIDTERKELLIKFS